MIYSVNFDLLKLYALLLTTAGGYYDLLGSVDLDATFKRSDVLESAGYFMHPTVAATYDAAATLCWASSRDMFSVKSQDMDLDEVFDQLNITDFSVVADAQIWTKMIKSVTVNQMVDQTGFAPKIMTKKQIIGMDDLKPTSFTSNRAAVLHKTTDGYRYDIIEKSSQRRTICLEKAQFGRSKKEVKILGLLKKSLMKEVDRLKDDIRFDFDHYTRLFSVMSPLPSQILAGIPKMDAIFERNLTDEITSLVPMSDNMKNLFLKIEEPLSLAELSVAHMELIHAFRGLKNRICAPFTSPLMIM